MLCSTTRQHDNASSATFIYLYLASSILHEHLLLRLDSRPSISVKISLATPVASSAMQVDCGCTSDSKFLRRSMDASMSASLSLSAGRHSVCHSHSELRMCRFERKTRSMDISVSASKYIPVRQHSVCYFHFERRIYEI